ncbi:MAG: MFS transporter [Chloroflexi bacterium]|nr:MFS transporter [Chloroflexota bacterium]
MKLPRNPLFWAVAFGHAVNDTFMSMGAVLLTFLSGSILPIGPREIGLAESFRQLVGSFSQPFFGWFVDQTGGRWAGAGGVAWTVSFMILGLTLGLATQNFWLMFIPYGLAALGSGAFHPVGSMHAAESDKAHATGNLSWFFLFGQLGLAFGPGIAGALIQISGSIVPVFALGVFAIPAVYVMGKHIPDRTAYQLTRPEKLERRQAINWKALPWKALGLLLLVVALRSVAQPGSGQFIPVLFEHKGWDPAFYGLITSTFWLASGFGGVYFGNLADRIDRRVVVAASLALCAPTFIFLPHVDGLLAFALALAAGGLSGGSHSILVSTAQELMPGSKAFASGAILGIIFGMGALGSLFIGTLAESTGLPTAFEIVGFITFGAAASAFLLPRPIRKAQATESENVALEAGD